MSWRVTLLEARLPRHAQTLTTVLSNLIRSDASLGRTRGPLVGRRKSATLNSPWAIVYRDDQARALHQTAEPDHDTLFIDTSPPGK